MTASVKICIFFLLNLSVVLRADMARDGEEPCYGGITLYMDDNTTRFISSKQAKVEVLVIISKVVLDGCACFTLHDKRGRSYFVERIGEHIAKEIGFNQVRSVVRDPGDLNGLPVWGFVITVIGVVILVVAAILLGLKSVTLPGVCENSKLET
eukprot:GFUD01060864.1.p1 GENE.GFUD01060864.1~~GFUD01060864.1.p1  ORF type:complete len:153 (-),score=38.70 GFUD01060864.1:265-723(-)